MRLHRLGITAFGPFSGTVEVDLDELSSAGLFLLSGPTGAGKTSVLDAVCFALYGDVPGERSTARRLRCDTAPPLRAPRVELEATLGDRRFRFVRQPAWERPKKRGTGTTTEQAKVLVEELDPGGAAPRTLTTRADEAGQLVTGLLGMTLTQFCQVALLPQGRFEAFLRARPDDRQRLLQRLFRTERFADVERWLRDHRSGLRGDLAEAHAAVAAGVDRLVEATGGARPPDDLLAAGPGADADQVAVDLAAWAAALRTDAAEVAGRTEAVARRSADSAETARERATAARRTLESVARGRAAADQLARLDAGADALDRARDRAALATRARPVVPLARLAEQARRDAVAAAVRADAASEACWTVVGAVQPTSDELREALATARERLAAARAALPRARARAEALAEAARAEQALARTAAQVATLDAEADGLPAALEEARTILATAVDEAARTAALTEEESDVEVRLQAALRAEAAAETLAPARGALDAARTRSLSLKEEWLTLREARLEGMAAELARDLAVGGCCPVCGSHSHPSKAATAAGAPGEREERAARRAHDDAEGERTAHEDHVRELDLALAASLAASGGASSAALRERRTTVRDALRAARAAESSLAVLSRTVTDLEATAERLEDERRSLDAEVVRLEEVRAQRLRAAEDAEADVRAALGGRPGEPGQVVDELAAAVALVEAALTTADDAQRAATQADVAEEAARACAEEHGFEGAGGTTAAVAAALPDEERLALERRVADADARRAAAAAVLADPVVAAALAQPEIDVDALTRVAATATADAEAAAGVAHLAAARAERARTLTADLGDALARWAPVHGAHALADHVASFCEGRSADNRQRTRLSAYVVAWRLGQVVDAANLRLHAMSDGRYALEHTGERGAGETRGGLGLLVRDAWSGVARDPATLSGGETFVVALALALGLADVVVQEAGGADLGTLFVDEGFGSLDADTLDDVLDHLDALRDGGRVVGVVSHVGEVRDRVPVRLEVRKDRGGSTLRTVRTGVL